jgi:uncharacterized phage protein (TIGR02220 family)
MNNSNIFRVVKNPDNPYVMVDKGFINNPKLSWKAKGILLYLLSKPHDWQVYGKDIVKHATEGRDSVSSGIAELMTHRYISRERKRDLQGRLRGYDYDVYEVPTENGLSVSGLSEIGKSALTNNDLELNNEETNNTMSAAPNTKDKPPYSEIIDLLNKYSGKKFKFAIKATQEHINARWREGYTFNDFETVIKYKCRQWKDDDKMNPYLRPATLFGTKFESYLNEKFISTRMVTD